jgi:extracellular elastinolytic metalloproteinase
VTGPADIDSRGTAYAGQQSASTTGLTDCKEGSDRGAVVHAAELQVFGEDATLPRQPDPTGGGTGARPGTTATTPTTAGRLKRIMVTGW